MGELLAAPALPEPVDEDRVDDLRSAFTRSAFDILTKPAVLARIEEDLVGKNAAARRAMLDLLLKSLLPLQQSVTSRKLVVHSHLARPPKGAA